MTNKIKVVVSGLGLVAANGQNGEEVFKNCFCGVSGLKPCSLFDASNLKTEYVGETDTASTGNRFFGILKKCVDEAMRSARITKEDVEKKGIRAALSFATLLAGNDIICDEEGDLTKIPDYLAEIKAYCGINGACYNDMSACAAGTTAVGIAFDLIRERKADLVICGGVDPLTKFSCYGFHALRSLSDGCCKPFDRERDGINIGEGGAFFVIESEKSALDRGAEILGEIVGYGIHNDAYHITSPDPEGSGALLSMSQATDGIDKNEIGYINAHGTGTHHNDEMEAKAIGKMFLGVSVSSTKSMTGHCLAAAGAIETALCLMAVQRGVILPTASTGTLADECDGNEYPLSGQKKEYRYALSNSFAFGGNTASLLIGKYRGE